MKIIERYGAGYRMLAGRGIWAALYPTRILLAGIYGLFVAVRTGRASSRRRGSVRDSDPRRPVIVSIGNIEAGGGGKTPCAIAVARGIAERGGLPVVVTRGYRGIAQRHAPCVVPAGRAMLPAPGAGFVIGEDLIGSSGAERGALAREAEALGDEVLIYRDRGISVIIDPRRGRGIELARRLFSPSHIILDDAFQNLSVAKDLDILLLDAEKPFDGGRVLPLGTLREHPRGARRADVVIFTRAREKRIPESALKYVEGKEVYFADHEPSGLIDRSGESIPLESLAGRECVLFSGIARPGSFERTILSLGAKPRAAFRFVDHHRYVREDIRPMLEEGGSDALFVTTEKDRAKAIDLFPGGTAVLALRVEMRIDRMNDLLDLLSTSSS
ncbi:MAG: tetraacyldisaccharide 4'-kinase [Candidatus Krumholzibacteria bacterium]|nr:tetraacyldisaccharide 4'-kinase [Candidatus Krumholzibacteria bacterium]